MPKGDAGEAVAESEVVGDTEDNIHLCDTLFGDSTIHVHLLYLQQNNQLLFSVVSAYMFSVR